MRDNPTAQSAITYALLIVPFNQLSFGLTSIYTVANYAIYTSAYVPGAPPLSVRDFFVWTVPDLLVERGAKLLAKLLYYTYATILG